MSAGCTAAMRGGVLHLTLDTRGSSVNVFTPAVALELERELRDGLARGARAVVLESAKPGSFINGVGLLLAASSNTESAAMERTRTLHRCYEALAAAPVPTIAAIAGNCYGCGLELALTCDYRIARDSYDTHFYMPELRDYAFIPLFGGTQRLPLLLGLRRGMEVLLGERIEARRARRMGLVDRLVPQPSIDGAVRSFLAGLRARDWPKRPPGRAPRNLPPSIEDLPGPERALAREGLRLARLPFKPGYRLERALREELDSFWRSVGTPEARRAMSFFFVRQTAKAHAIGSVAYERPSRLSVSVAPSNRPLRELRQILSRRRLPGIELGPRGTLAFADAKVSGAFTCTLGGGTGGDCSAFLPFPRETVPAIEIVPSSDEMPWKRGADLFQVLEQAGFAPVVTRSRHGFVSERLISAFLDAAGSAPARRALLEFGFRLPAPLARKLRAGGRGNRLGDRVAAALAAECVRALDEGALVHPAQADLLAHVLFGFPVVRGGLLRHAAGGRSAVARDAARILGRLA
ncbi:MAG TPA: enoyl-CoA hydratase/isomerase family protein [Myxococcales bacterium]|nr:enoyl-CoA hydratase/isomerase family protein [Myxococcales bacterium]